MRLVRKAFLKYSDKMVWHKRFSYFILYSPHVYTCNCNLRKSFGLYFVTTILDFLGCFISFLFLQMAGRILVMRSTSLADFTKRYSYS
jgi:hypothetical protein